MLLIAGEIQFAADAPTSSLQDLPLKNLGLEGTPHFMAPEVCG
jgi:hypothetical protein